MMYKLGFCDTRSLDKDAGALELEYENYELDSMVMWVLKGRYFGPSTLQVTSEWTE